MLEIKDLTVTTKDNKKILDKFNLNINKGEVHVIMGPNGTGKSTLSKVIMGSTDYIIEKGTIKYKDKIINDVEVDERARMGIFLAYQSPISIEGITNSEFLKTALNSKLDENIGLYQFIKLMDKSIEDLKMNPTMLHRSINQDFSGGERKKNEILQMKVLKPNFVMLDELDSGLDVDSLKIVCDNINNYLIENPETSILIITHYPKILEYIKPNYVHIMKDGNIIKTGDINLAKQIEKEGFTGLKAVNEDDNYE